MHKKAIFPGSFDPFTNGHANIVERALRIFDEIVVAIGHNSAKEYAFELEKRKQWIESVYANEQRVSVGYYEGMTIAYCKEVDANYIVRGLRSAPDFNFESSIAQMNYKMDGNIETVFLLTDPELSAINSTIVRDIIKHGGDASKFVPPQVKL